jgi:hypothetical protein
MVGGDTLVIDGTNNAQYMIGYGSPNTGDTSKCNTGWPWDCMLRPVPSGPDAAHPTRILGKGWDSGCAQAPQLWGRERIPMVVNLTGSDNVELQCLEITDHSDCQDPGPKACNRSGYPYGNWADKGIYASDSSNVVLKNVNIHGLAHVGVHAGRLSDWVVENSKIVANPFAGWDGDIGADASSDSGTMMFSKVTVAYNGCGETYPGKTPFNCFSQSQGGYGDGLGMANTDGRWVFNQCDVSHNTSDGIDLLYHTGNGNISVLRTRAEGNAGNQVKLAAQSYISNSLIIGNCSYFNNNPITYSPSTFDHCRAQGNAVSIRYKPSMLVELYNSTVVSNGDGLLLSHGSQCVGGETLKSRNNIFLGRPDFWQGDNSVLYYAAGATGNGDGPCANVKLDDDYSIIYGTRGGSADCVNKPHSKCTNPILGEPLVSFYGGNAYNANLQGNSPAVGAGILMAGMSALDYNGNNRGSDAWDMGALEYGATAPSSGATPKVTLTQPTNGTTLYNAPTSISLSANASEDGGNISKVQFFNGQYALNYTGTSAPYSYTWKNVQPGTYTLTAKATDDAGNEAESDPVTITVSSTQNNPPVVSLTAPTNASTFNGPTSITLSANASEEGGTISKVQFFNGSVPLNYTGTSAPYSYTWKNVQPGTYSLTAQATDSNGFVANSTPVVITVNAGIPATVNLISPSNNSAFSGPANVTFTADAVASEGSTISKVQFFNGSVPLNYTGTTEPYSYTWKNVQPGTYTMTAQATDSNGYVATSAPVTIAVTAGSPTSVNLTEPATNSSFAGPANITLAADALASEGNTVTKVQFFNGTTPLSYVGNSAPFTYVWKNVQPGTYTMTAQATDSSGYVATSEPITLSVSAGSPTSVSLTAPGNNSTFTGPLNVDLAADVQPSEGNTITKVQFFNGTVPLNYAGTTPPYAYIWKNVLPGTYTMTVQATDTSGYVATSDPVTINVF